MLTDASDSLATVHFGRPSLCFDARLQLYFEDVPTPNVLSDELYVTNCLNSISRALNTIPTPTEALLEALIPPALHVTSFDPEIGLISATLYTALGPLLTDPGSIVGVGILTTPSPRLVHVIAKSASVLIDHFTQLNKRNMIISIWVAAELVLKAGAVWAASLMHKQQISGPTVPRHIFATELDVTMGPIIKVSSLLASFAARWNAGSIYVQSWETLVELFWKML